MLQNFTYILFNALCKIPSDAIAIGTGAEAKKNKAVAIGHNAKATQENQIVLGTADSTVYIPGRLVVGKDVLLNAQEGTVVLRTFESRGDPDEEKEYFDHSKVNNKSGLSFFKSHDYNGNDDNLGIYQDLKNRKTSGDYGWFTNGQVSFFDYYINTTTNINSDRRLKNVGKAFTGGLAELKKLDLFHFRYKKDRSNTPHVGVMAQDLQKVFPDAVVKGEDGFLRIHLEDMFYALVNAVKELDKKFDILAQKQKKIDELESKISDLEKQNNEILKRLAKLEKQK